MAVLAPPLSHMLIERPAMQAGTRMLAPRPQHRCRAKLRRQVGLAIGEYVYI